MDILAHGLWAGAAGKAAKLKEKSRIKLGIMVIFGIFPDFFAFAPAFIYMFASYLIPGVPKIEHPGPTHMEPATGNTLLILNITHNLYNISHSILIFFLVFLLALAIFRRPIWELSGWFVHIIMDIPSHSYDFFPTPFLWPVSEFKINGIHWGESWFMILNYSLIILAYLLVSFKKRNLTKKKA